MLQHGLAVSFCRAQPPQRGSDSAMQEGACGRTRRQFCQPGPQQQRETKWAPRPVALFTQGANARTSPLYKSNGPAQGNSDAARTRLRDGRWRGATSHRLINPAQELRPWVRQRRRPSPRPPAKPPQTNKAPRLQRQPLHYQPRPLRPEAVWRCSDLPEPAVKFCRRPWARPQGRH